MDINELADKLDGDSFRLWFDHADLVWRAKFGRCGGEAHTPTKAIFSALDCREALKVRPHDDATIYEMDMTGGKDE